MQVINNNQQVPVYSLEPDELTGNQYIRVYNFEGVISHRADFLLPHRKDHYLMSFIRSAGSRQWIDMQPYILRDNTIYFTRPHQMIVKEEFTHLSTTGIAFTKEFLALQENGTLSRLPLIQNPHKGPEIFLAEADIAFVEDILTKINEEYKHPGEWQQRMLNAYMTVLLTYLSRLYTVQVNNTDTTAETLLLKRFQDKINECYRELHEVSDYASLLHISAGHLSEVVKTQSGKPAIKHIHERVVLEARRLLFHTDTTSKEIAFDLGFSDASYFNRFFKRETGVTPAQYRVNIREMYH